MVTHNKSLPDKAAIWRVLGPFHAGAIASAEQHDTLVKELFEAVCFAKAGLNGILAGKRVRPGSWVMDIFVFDVCDALRNAGRRHTPMSQKPSLRRKLHPQVLAAAVAQACGLPRITKGQQPYGTLFKQIQRAKKIKLLRRERNGKLLFLANQEITSA